MVRTKVSKGGGEGRQTLLLPQRTSIKQTGRRRNRLKLDKRPEITTGVFTLNPNRILTHVAGFTALLYCFIFLPCITIRFKRFSASRLFYKNFTVRALVFTHHYRKQKREKSLPKTLNQKSDFILMISYCICLFVLCNNYISFGFKTQLTIEMSSKSKSEKIQSGCIWLRLLPF